MYYITTSTLDIDPEMNPIKLESTSINPEPQSSPSTRGRDQGRGRQMTTAARIAALEQLIMENNDSPYLRRIDMADVLGVGLSRIKDDLRLLAAQGKVVFVGVGSHSGHWHIVGDPETEAEVEQWLSTPGYELLQGTRGRYSSTSIPKSGASTPKKTQSTPKVAKAVAHTALNCLAAAVQTPYALRKDVCCAPSQWRTPMRHTNELWHYE